MIDEQNFFNQPVKNNLRIYDSIGNIATDQGDGFKKCYNMIAIDLSKQQTLDANPKVIQKLFLQKI